MTSVLFLGYLSFVNELLNIYNCEPRCLPRRSHMRGQAPPLGSGVGGNPSGRTRRGDSRIALVRHCERIRVAIPLHTVIPTPHRHLDRMYSWVERSHINTFIFYFCGVRFFDSLRSLRMTMYVPRNDDRGKFWHKKIPALFLRERGHNTRRPWWPGWPRRRLSSSRE
jgi:hypothetical protein